MIPRIVVPISRPVLFINTTAPPIFWLVESRPLLPRAPSACHGDGGKGNQELGAPNLTDAIWLYGSGEGAVAAQVKAPRHGIMPAWGARLGDTTVKELTVFVHSLGGGE